MCVDRVWLRVRKIVNVFIVVVRNVRAWLCVRKTVNVNPFLASSPIMQATAALVSALIVGTHGSKLVRASWATDVYPRITNAAANLTSTLELAAGDGEFTAKLRRIASRVTAIETNEVCVLRHRTCALADIYVPLC